MNTLPMACETCVYGPAVNDAISRLNKQSVLLNELSQECYTRDTNDGLQSCPKVLGIIAVFRSLDVLDQ